ncbi:FH1/FH2 domain-containing protein 3-like isoform X2 [Hypanus sabinus]|uniref:FH1/FH2 domain-containing protein 3-like isoform X2 n=1 Tax=Hypanus sabinus TaxID=79690 RepID=UPI0028C42CA4|nr:FH1/FH2 domain-containing protein 3-like isoform X2 [Hypanus sabinus]
MKTGAAEPQDGDGVPEARRGLEQLWDVLLGSARELRLKTLDFSDLQEEEEEGDARPRSHGPTPCPTQGTGPPPPPPLPLPPPPPPPPSPLAGATPRTGGGRGTRRLHWKGIAELPAQPKFSRFGPATIWDGLQPVALDTERLRELFQRSAGDPQHLQKQGAGRRRELNVLPVKRSNGINIALTALPPPHIIHAALLSFDRCALDREAIERLQTLVPTEEEVQQIQEAQRSKPGQALGSAEHFLLRLATVPELTARLSLWAFILDYDTMEKEVAEALFDLKLGMEQLAGNRTFHCILATLLAIGNFLNGVNAKGFELWYLERVPGVKDTACKKSLLHHACSIIVQNFPDTSDLYSEISALTRSTKVDFVQLQTDLAQLEHICKASWDHLKTISRRDRNAAFRSSTASFLREAAQRIIILKAVYRRLRNRFHSFLLYLGYPSSYVRKATVSRFCKMISDFALEYHMARLQVLQQRERQEREKQRQQAEDVPSAGETDSPQSVAVVIRSLFPECSQQHEDMKEILRTPERSRKFDNSLPRFRRKVSQGKEILDQKLHW